jgi:hypothetical protein
VTLWPAPSPVGSVEQYEEIDLSAEVVRFVPIRSRDETPACAARLAAASEASVARESCEHVGFATMQTPCERIARAAVRLEREQAVEIAGELLELVSGHAASASRSSSFRATRRRS